MFSIILSAADSMAMHEVQCNWSLNDWLVTEYHYKFQQKLMDRKRDFKEKTKHYQLKCGFRQQKQKVQLKKTDRFRRKLLNTI